MISLFAMIFSISSFAQNFNHKPAPKAPKAPKVEEIAKWRADHMKKAYNLDKWQYDKLYKLYLKQAKKQAAQMKQAKKEREQMQEQMRKILNDEQWARYQKMQQRMRFRPGKQMGKPNGKPANQKPAINNNRQKGPVIEKPQSKRNNMYLER